MTTGRRAKTDQVLAGRNTKDQLDEFLDALRHYAR